jgi:ATP-dependent DNA helicase RecQ
VQNDPLYILKKYWGYESFRPFQQEIIQSVLSGNDTLALMATGGGKSICYQVPAMMKAGVCIVISPLISLMKDQVDDLARKGLQAQTINYSMFGTKIEAILNAAVHQRLKFLFIAPERIRSRTFIEAFKQMKVSMLVVDEAHCISLWGHDFRPSYLQIKKLRDLQPDAPILALTATATEKVKEEIQSLLAFRRKNVIQASFLRENFRYIVCRERNKTNKIAYLYNKFKGCSGIIYVRSRAKAENLAKELTERGLNAVSYHAGLPLYERNARQNLWKEGKIPLVVATTAFGMGIDKADVRYVVHTDVPENMEAYFQETGRAGRDGKEAYAVLMYEKEDLQSLYGRIESQYPETALVEKVYTALYNFYKLPFGSGKASIFSFNIRNFVHKYAFDPVFVFNALRILELNGFIAFNELEKAELWAVITVDKYDLLDFIALNPQYNPLIECLLRNYPAIRTELTRINPIEISKKIYEKPSRVVKDLQQLHTYGIMDVRSFESGQQIVFLEDRLPSSHFAVMQEYSQLRKLAKKDEEIMLSYLESFKCRQQQILKHFGEKISNCGRCDVCVRNRETNREVRKFILDFLRSGSQPFSALAANFDPLRENELMDVVIDMADERIIETDRLMLSLKPKK